MTFEQARPIVEARLFAYAMLIREYPDAPPSSLSQRLGTSVQTSDTTSTQERWAARHASELANAAIIERVLKVLPGDERRLVEMRYFEYARWDYICKTLAVSRPTAYRIRDRALMVFAHEFGLLACATAS